MEEKEKEENIYGRKVFCVRRRRRTEKEEGEKNDIRKRRKIFDPWRR